jgi:hypothetical protein
MKPATASRTPNAAALQRTRALIAASPIGLTSRELSAATGMSHGTAVRWAWGAKLAGMVERISGGPTARWCVPSNREAAMAEVQRIQRERRREAELRHAPRKAARRATSRRTLADAEIRRVLVPTQYTVPAAEAAPMRMLGYASIFDLGKAMAAG